MSIKSLPPVKTFPSTASVVEVVRAIKLSGGCIIKNILTPKENKQIEHDMRPHIEADKPWPGSFFPPQTRRVTGLVGKSDTFMHKILLNPLYQGVCQAFLKEESWYWTGNEKVPSVSHPQLHNTFCFSIRPGAKNQGLHRDDATHLIRHEALDKYPENPGHSKRDNGVGLFVAGTRTTQQNGATRFIPGSHLYAHEHEPNEVDTIHAELNPGDGFIMLSSCLHGGSANKTEDEERLLYSLFMTRGYFRQEENQYLTYPADLVKTWPEEVQKLIGYQLSEPFLGWVATKDPRCVLDSSIGTMSV